MSMRLFKSLYDTDLTLQNGQTIPKGATIAVSDLHYESLQHSDTYKAWVKLGLIEEVEPASKKQATADFVLPEPVRDVVDEEVQETNDVPPFQPRGRKK